MYFSELFDGKCAVFSPNGLMLACLCGDHVEVRFSDTLLKAFNFECAGIVKAVIWSGDSTLLLCQFGVANLKLFSIDSGSCVSSYHLHLGSINQISWAGDCRSVLFLERHLLRVAVLRPFAQYGQDALSYINNIQPWSKHSVALSPNGMQLAVVECPITDSCCMSDDNADSAPTNVRSVDRVAVFSAISWRKEKSIKLDGIQRVGGLAWSPNSNYIAVWPCDPSDALHIICVRSSTIIGKWQSSAQLCPGVRRVEFSPSSQFMAVVGHNSKVQILNCIAWCEEFNLVHDSSVTDFSCRVYQESLSNGIEDLQFVEIKERPVSISSLSDLGNIKKSSKVAWSSGGRYIASCVACAPAVIWVWSAGHSFKISCVIVTKHPIQDFQWDPVRNVLAIVDGQDFVILWNADEEILTWPSVCTPVSKMLFQAHHLNWRLDGKVLALSSQQSSAILELNASKT